MFTILSIVLWYALDFIKKILTRVSGEEKRINDLTYDLIVWGIAISLGMALSFQFRTDAFVIVSQLMRGISKIPIIKPSIMGQIFGGLLLASGSGVVNNLMKAINKEIPEPPKELIYVEPDGTIAKG